MTKLVEVSGRLVIRNGDAEVLYLEGDDDPLAERLDALCGKRVSVRYWITDKQVTRDEAAEEFLRKVMGVANVRYKSHYSEATGYLWTDQDLKVGGHDLIREFLLHDGDWLIFEAEVHE